MNKRNLALLISKHPLLRKLTEDKTIPNSIVARLIVEELTKTSHNLLFEGSPNDWDEYEARIDQAIKDKDKDSLTQFFKQLYAALEKRTYEEGKPEIARVRSMLEKVKIAIPAIAGIPATKEEPEKQPEESDVLEDLAFYMGLAAAPISFVPGVGQAAGTALSIGSDLLTSADIIGDIQKGNTSQATTKLMSIIGANIAAGLIPGGIAAKEGGKATAKAAGKTAFAKTATVLTNKLGKQISEKAVEKAVKKAAKAVAKQGGAKIGEMISQKAQEHAEKINDDDELKQSIFGQGQDILGNAWDKFKGMFTSDDNAESESSPAVEKIASVIVDLNKQEEFLTTYDQDNLSLTLDFVRDNLPEEQVDVLNTARPEAQQKVVQAVADELQKDQQEKPQEPGKKEKPSTPMKGKPVAIDPAQAGAFVGAANELLNDFYNQKYRKDQATIVGKVIDSMKAFVEDADLALAFGKPPADKPEEQEATSEEPPKEQEATSEEPKTLAEQEGEEVKADKDEMRNIRIGLRSFLSRVNKTNKYLTEFEKVAGAGSVLSDAYKKKFMDNLKEIQTAIYRLALVLNKMLDSKEELNEKKESETMKKWREVQKLYDLSIKSVSSVKELLDTETPPDELDSTLTNDAYTALINLAGHFPHIAPFGAGKMKRSNFVEYKTKFANAIGQVKSDLQNVFNLIKTGEAGEESLQNARDGLRDFGDAIASIFGVPSRFKDAKVKPGDDKAPAVQEDPQTEKSPSEDTDKEAQIEAKEAIEDFLKILLDSNIILPKQSDSKLSEILDTIAIATVGGAAIAALIKQAATRYSSSDKAVLNIFKNLLYKFLQKNKFINPDFESEKIAPDRFTDAFNNFPTEKKAAIAKAYRKKFKEKPQLTGKEVQKIVANYLTDDFELEDSEDEKEQPGEVEVEETFAEEIQKATSQIKKILPIEKFKEHADEKYYNTFIKLILIMYSKNQLTEEVKVDSIVPPLMRAASSGMFEQRALKEKLKSLRKNNNRLVSTISSMTSGINTNSMKILLEIIAANKSKIDSLDFDAILSKDFINDSSFSPEQETSDLNSKQEETITSAAAEALTDVKKENPDASQEETIQAATEKALQQSEVQAIVPTNEKEKERITKQVEDAVLKKDFESHSTAIRNTKKEQDAAGHVLNMTNHIATKIGRDFTDLDEKVQIALGIFFAFITDLPAPATAFEENQNSEEIFTAQLGKIFDKGRAKEMLNLMKERKVYNDFVEYFSKNRKQIQEFGNQLNLDVVKNLVPDETSPVISKEKSSGFEKLTMQALVKVKEEAPDIDREEQIKKTVEKVLKDPKVQKAIDKAVEPNEKEDKIKDKINSLLDKPEADVKKDEQISSRAKDLISKGAHSQFAGELDKLTSVTFAKINKDEFSKSGIALERILTVPEDSTDVLKEQIIRMGGLKSFYNYLITKKDWYKEGYGFIYVDYEKFSNVISVETFLDDKDFFEFPSKGSPLEERISKN